MPYVMALYGTGDNTKTDEFSEKTKQALPPPPFSENHNAILIWKALFKALYKIALRELHSYTL